MKVASWMLCRSPTLYSVPFAYIQSTEYAFFTSSCIIRSMCVCDLVFDWCVICVCKVLNRCFGRSSAGVLCQYQMCSVDAFCGFILLCGTVQHVPYIQAGATCKCFPQMLMAGAMHRCTFQTLLYNICLVLILRNLTINSMFFLMFLFIVSKF